MKKINDNLLKYETIDITDIITLIDGWEIIQPSTLKRMGNHITGCLYVHKTESTASKDVAYLKSGYAPSITRYTYSLVSNEYVQFSTEQIAAAITSRGSIFLFSTDYSYYAIDIDYVF